MYLVEPGEREAAVCSWRRRHRSRDLPASVWENLRDSVANDPRTWWEMKCWLQKAEAAPRPPASAARCQASKATTTARWSLLALGIAASSACFAACVGKSLPFRVGLLPQDHCVHCVLRAGS